MSKTERAISSKVKIDGDKEYRQALSNINQDLKTVKAEMYKVSAEYTNNSKTVEALTEKHRLLETQEMAQADKVKILKEMLEKVNAKFGESSKQSADLTQELYYAEGQWAKTVAEIENCDDALEDAQKGFGDFMEETTGLGDILDTVGNKFGITIPEGMKTSLNGMAEFSASSVVAIGAVATAVKLVVDAVVDLAEKTKEVAGYVDDLNTTATTSGIDTYTLQVLNYMEDLADTDVSTVTGAMTKLTKAMDSASSGTKGTIEAFEKLGVTWDDGFGNLRDSQDVFWEAIDALGQMQNETERDAVAMDLFGKSAKELNTLVAIGSDGFREFADEAENVGYIMSEEQMKALNDYNDALDRATKQQDAINQQMASIMAPALQKLTEGWSNLKTEGLQLIIDSGIIDFLADVIEVIGVVIDFVGDMIEVLNALMHPIETLNELFGISNTTVEENAKLTKEATKAHKEQKSALDAQATSADNATRAMKQLTQEQKNYLKSVGITADNIGTIDGNYVQAIKGYDGTVNYYNVDTADYSWADKIDWGDSNSVDMRTKRNASGSYNFRGGYTWVGESGAELVKLPSGSQIYNSQDSRNIGGNTFYVTIDAKNVKEFNDIVAMAQNSRVASRMRG